jgi:hypothetical protein
MQNTCPMIVDASRFVRHQLVAVSISMVAACVGCGGPGLVPVEGNVTLDGEPLSGATVGMELVDGPREFRLFSAETDASGRYVLRSFESGAPGAMPGQYRVMIHSIKTPSNVDETYVAPRDPVPEPYRDGSLVISVPEGGTKSADIEIKSR